MTQGRAPIARLDRHAFGRGNVTAYYRYLDYRMKSGQLIDAVNPSWPLTGVGFHL